MEAAEATDHGCVGRVAATTGITTAVTRRLLAATPIPVITPPVMWGSIRLLGGGGVRDSMVVDGTGRVVFVGSDSHYGTQKNGVWAFRENGAPVFLGHDVPVRRVAMEN